MLTCYSVIVRGKVQGVYYRASTRETALAMGLKGEVRNKKDGSVHILVVGNKTALDSFCSWCHKGPPSAIVESVEVKVENSIPDFSSFEIRY